MFDTVIEEVIECPENTNLTNYDPEEEETFQEPIIMKKLKLHLLTQSTPTVFAALPTVDSTSRLPKILRHRTI